MLLSTFIITGDVAEHCTDPPLVVFDVQMKQTTLLLAQNHTGWEGPPEVLWDSLPLPHSAGTESCLEPRPVKFWVSPKMELSQPL